MPFYEYRCSRCGETAQSRRSYDAMNDPGPDCASCRLPTERIFSPTSNIHISTAFKSGLSWSDFHDVSERELARQNPDLEPVNRVRSRPDGSLVREQKEFAEIEKAAVDTWREMDAISSARGVAIDGS